MNLKFVGKLKRTYTNSTLHDLSVSRIHTYKTVVKPVEASKPLLVWKGGVEGARNKESFKKGL